MSIAALIVLVLVGAIAGWLAGLFVKGSGFGFWGNVAVGIVGAVIGNFVLGAVGLVFGTSIVGAIIRATIGAVLLLVVVQVVRR